MQELMFLMTGMISKVTLIFFYIFMDTVLTEDQQRLVSAAGRVVIGCAYPGTGKTSCLIERAQLTDPTKTLITTFTRRCKNEIETRLSRKGCSVRVSTLHGLAYDLLVDNWDEVKLMTSPNSPHELPILMKEEEELELIHSEFSEKVGLRLIQTREKASKYRFDTTSLLKLKNSSVYLPGLERKDLELLRLYDEWRLSYGFLLFKDLIPLALKALKIPSVSNKFYTAYQHVLIDEAQDLSDEQWLVLEPFLLFTHSIFLIGDINQSIFGYAGGDGNTLKRLMSYPESEVLYLVENFRSGTEIVKATNLLISDTNPKMVAVKAKAGLVEIRGFETLDEEINFIKSLSDDYAILARTNSLLENFKLTTENRKELFTVHSAKGKEWDKVVLMGASSKHMPHILSNDIQEEKNIFYVAISRAKQELLITYSGNPSIFLGDIRKLKKED